jgi:hypothetical protein
MGNAQGDRARLAEPPRRKFAFNRGVKHTRGECPANLAVACAFNRRDPHKAG